jgi:hypothetical protein
MVPSTYHAYFGGCASVAGTLIGLLFVAISVSPHKDTGPRAPLSFLVAVSYGAWPSSPSLAAFSSCNC